MPRQPLHNTAEPALTRQLGPAFTAARYETLSRCLPVPMLGADDTAAFLSAVAQASAEAKRTSQGVAVLVPKGRYRITQKIVIEQSNVVLRGEGVSAPARRGGASCCEGLSSHGPEALVQALLPRRQPCLLIPTASCACTMRSCSLFDSSHRAPPARLPARLQPGATTLYYPKPLASVYGTGTVWAFGGTWLTCAAPGYAQGVDARVAAAEQHRGHSDAERSMP